MTLLQIDKHLANILMPIASSLEANEAIAEYAREQIKHLHEQFHHVDANNIAEVAKLQGKYEVYKALMTLRQDVQAVRGMF